MTATGRKSERRQKGAHSTPKVRTPRKGARRRSPAADITTTLSKLAQQGTVSRYRKNQVVFAQGDRADAVFYIQTGEVKLAVVSPGGKSAIVAVLRAGDFLGHGCLTGQPLRMATASTVTETSVVRIEKARMTRLLAEDAAFSGVFISYLLTRMIRIEEDLVDRLFNSSEKRLARMLLLLRAVGKKAGAGPVIPRITQEALAEMIGTTRARVSGFMNKFRKLGLIDYNGGLRVHDALVNVILHD
jgi:CRP/FNR family transcriptional regulator, cyclic AMP receptor protein